MSYITKTYLETQFKNFAEKIKSLLNNKVEKVEGKGLSTNDLTSDLKNNYDTAYNHSQTTHARTDATKVEKSSTNGNIKINGTETTVYTHPSGTNPHGTTKSDVGLGNVGNFKAVSTVANQGLSDTEKANARANIGAGASNFSGSYNDLTDKPTIPTVGNGTVTIKQVGASKGTFTMNQSGNTTIELTDNNTWRGIQNNLTSDSTTDSLSAAQGKVLKDLVDGKAESSHTHSNYAQNAFSKVYCGGKEALIEAGTKNDSLTINPGKNILIMTDSVDKSFTITAIDTKNTAGSTDTSSKIFLVGTTSQADNSQTYSHDTVYVGTDGCLYSNNKKVSVDGHTHDDRYYTEAEIDNTLNSISGTIFNNNISKKNFTYVVYNPDTLKDWIENKSGNDYTSVLIKKGTYQYTVTNSNNFVSVDKQGTLYIEGEEGSKLFITYDANVNSHYYLIRGVEKTDEDTSELSLDFYPENPTNLEISSTTTSENISRNRMSLNNVNIYLETYAHKNSSEYYIGILRFANGVNNCRFEIKLQCSCKQTTACCYYTCTNLNNCKGITTANYDSTLTPKTGYDRLRPYYNCRRVINCYAYGSGGYSGGAFYNGDHIINCNAKFVDMYYGETFYKVSHVIGCRSYASVGTENGGSACAYKNCKKMLYNYAAAGSYSGSYASDNTDSTYLCANTLNGGWNS